MDKVKCAICGEEFEPADIQSICLKCQEKINRGLGIKPSEDAKAFTQKDIDYAISSFVWLVSKLGAEIDYLLHAIDHHTHSTKTVEVVDVE